jgi:flagellar hook-associated protein 3 FlgL
MSSTISLANNEYGAFGGGINGLVIGDSVAVKQQLDTLTQQASDGLIADTYAGLGDGTTTALALPPQLTNLQTYQQNIANATSTATVAQNALTQISSIASTFMDDTDTEISGADYSDVDTVAASARQALQQVANLLDETDGSTYVFGGQDNTNPPVPNPNGILSSGFYTQIQAAVSNLGGAGATATISSTLAIASSNAAGTSPFSATLSQPASALANFLPTVASGPGQQTQIGILASSNAFVASTGASTTGSYTRDILRALATLGSLSSSQASDPGFDQLVSDAATSLNGAITALNQDAGVLGNQQSQLQSQSTVLGNTSTALQTQLGNARDVDMTSVLSQLTQTETRLQASYQLIANVQSLSLVKFLPAPS